MARGKTRTADPGFALPLALLTIAIIASIFSIGALQIRSSLKALGAASIRREAVIKLYSAEQTMAYVIAANSVDRNGLRVGGSHILMSVALGARAYHRGEVGIIPLDGRACELDIDGESATVQLQDAAGLIDLNRADGQMLERLFRQLGIPSARASSLSDRLQDFREFDVNRRLNGASDAEYLEVGLPAPTKSPLRRVDEAKSVLGFAQEEKLWATDGLLSLATVSGEAYVNPNTAPSRVLETAFGLTPDGAQRLVRARQLNPLNSLGDLQKAANEPATAASDAMGLGVGFQPGESVVVRLSAREAGITYSFVLQVTPEAERQPFEVVERSVYATPLQDENADDGSPNQGALPDFDFEISDESREENSGLCPTAIKLDIDRQR